MRKIILFLLLFSFCQVGHSASSGDLGLGIILGAPTALTGKYLAGNNLAYDFGLAFSFDDYVLIYGDRLVPVPGGFGRKTKFASQITPYYGIGGVIVVTNKDRSSNDRILGKKSGSFGLGLRIPLGIEWRPSQPDFAFFLEIVPGISVIPETSAMFQGGIGLRYFF